MGMTAARRRHLLEWAALLSVVWVFGGYIYLFHVHL